MLWDQFFIAQCLLFFLTGSAALTVILNYLGTWRWRRSGPIHWAERARLLYPVRVAASLNLILISGFSILIAYNLLDSFQSALWGGAASLVGGILGCYPLDHRIMPELTFRSWLGHVCFGWGIRILFFGPLLLAIAFMPPTWNWKLLWIVIPFTLWHVWFATGGLIQLLRWARLLKLFSPTDADMLEDSFAKAQLRPRRVLLLSSPFAMAYAFPFRKELVFSQGLLDRCDRAELNAISLHELAHLSEDRQMLAKRLLISFIFYPFIFIRPVLRSWDLWGLAAIYFFFLLFIILARRVGRKGEVRADHIAATHELNEGTYARALEKVYEVNQMPAVMRGKRLTHPHLYDRMLAAGVTPDFPRPNPPAAFSWTTLIPIAMAILWYTTTQL
jgi:Zn-dependent protease with chaperone function